MSTVPCLEHKLTSFTANKTFLEHFDGSAIGVWAALASAMYQIGAVVALPFAGPCIDGLGRRSWGAGGGTAGPRGGAFASGVAAAGIVLARVGAGDFARGADRAVARGGAGNVGGRRCREQPIAGRGAGDDAGRASAVDWGAR